MGIDNRMDRVTREKIKRHRRRKRMGLGTIAVVIMSAAVVVLLYFFTIIKNFEVDGTQYLKADMVQNMFFPSEQETRYYHARWKWSKDKKGSFPMIASYQITFENKNSVHISIQENALLCGVKYVDTYLYLDCDGYIMLNQSEKLENIPIMEGVVFEQCALYKKLESTQRERLDQGLYAADLLHEYGLDVERICWDEEERLCIVRKNVIVNLGTGSDLEKKIAELKDMLPKLEGLSGIMHMEVYDTKTGYVFEQPVMNESVPDESTSVESETGE